jgi:predicted nucleic acid-binding protein
VRVVDASVVIKWLIREPDHQRAIEILRAYVGRITMLIAPRVLADEVAGAIAKQYRRKSLTAEQAIHAFDLFETYRPDLLDPPGLTRQAFDLSLQHRISAWDCLYLALATRYRCDLVTADERFQRAVKPHYPFVVLLGA